MSAPFGIEMHSQLDGLAVEHDLGAGSYQVAPPKPHPAFVEYYVRHSGRYGIVWVKAISPPFETDAYGSNVRAALERIWGQLESRYGKPRTIDFLHHGALFEESRDWVMSLLQHERSFFHIWEKDKVPNLPEDLQSVFLGVVAHNPSDSSVILEYASPSLDAVERETDNDLSDLL